MIEVNKGDSIEVKAQGITVKGEVRSADYYDDAGWYIEIINANVPGGYSYWKQRDDGGYIAKLNGKELKKTL